MNKFIAYLEKQQELFGNNRKRMVKTDLGNGIIKIILKEGNNNE